MRTYEVPLLCWKVNDGLYVGKLLFAGYNSLEIARGSVAAVTAALAEELRRPEAPSPMEVEEVGMRRIIVAIRPTWRIGRSSMVLPDVIHIPVDVVYAETEAGLRIAELPRFGHSFHFEDLSQLETLVPHFVREATMHSPPEALAKLLMAPPPTLESVRMRESEELRETQEELPERLSAVADRLPISSKGSLLPQAAWEREALVERLVALLDEGGSLVIVGESQVGKSALLREAIRIAARTKLRTFWRSTAHRLLSGARFLGEWQGLCDTLVTELEQVNGTLWIEDLPEMLRVGGQGPQDSLAAYLRPALAAGRFRLVGELTPRGLEALRTLAPAFFDLLEPVVVEELSPAAIREVVSRLANHVEIHHKIRITPEARQLSLALLGRHVPAEHMPGKVISFLGACVADAERQNLREINEKDVMAAVVRRTGMPPVLIDDRLRLSADTLKSWLSQKIVSQPEALDAATRVILTFKAGLSDPGRPLATLLFAGPTGVGKTATAKALAEWCFGQGQTSAPLVRVDMSELQHPAQIGRLIGDGRQPGELVRQVREKPFCVLLFDEIEKAHPSFFDTLMTVLDEGTLTDAFGRTTDFRRCIVILTTNLGSHAGGSLGFSGASSSTSMAEIRKHFRPEFYNRLDQVVRFLPLDAVAIDAIARRELASVAARDGIRSRELTLIFGESLIQRVASAGFDPRWGARLLQRTIEQLVVAPLARFLLENPKLEGMSLLMDLEGGHVEIVAA